MLSVFWMPMTNFFLAWIFTQLKRKPWNAETVKQMNRCLGTTTSSSRIINESLSHYRKFWIKYFGQWKSVRFFRDFYKNFKKSSPEETAKKTEQYYCVAFTWPLPSLSLLRQWSTGLPCPRVLFRLTSTKLKATSRLETLHACTRPLASAWLTSPVSALGTPRGTWPTAKAFLKAATYNL